MLKLDSTDMGHLAQSKITFIYNFSQVSSLSSSAGLCYLPSNIGRCAEATGLGRFNGDFRIVSALRLTFHRWPR